MTERSPRWASHADCWWLKPECATGYQPAGCLETPSAPPNLHDLSKGSAGVFWRTSVQEESAQVPRCSSSASFSSLHLVLLHWFPSSSFLRHLHYSPHLLPPPPILCFLVPPRKRCIHFSVWNKRKKMETHIIQVDLLNNRRKTMLVSYFDRHWWPLTNWKCQFLQFLDISWLMRIVGIFQFYVPWGDVLTLRAMRVTFSVTTTENSLGKRLQFSSSWDEGKLMEVWGLEKWTPLTPPACFKCTPGTSLEGSLSRTNDRRSKGSNSETSGRVFYSRLLLWTNEAQWRNWVLQALRSVALRIYKGSLKLMTELVRACVTRPMCEN